MDGFRSNLVDVVSGVPQGNVLGQQYSPSTPRISPYWENKLYCYADDSTLIAVVPSQCERVAVTEFLNRDLNRVSSMWCNPCDMNLNASKIKTMIVSTSGTIRPQSIPLTRDGTVLKESVDLVILGVTLVHDVG